LDNSFAIGRWAEILSLLGIEVPQNAQTHGPCPICGKGRNGHRFRFDDQEGRGTWICNTCGAGDGWDLLQKVFNINFGEAKKTVALKLGVDLFHSDEHKKAVEEKEKVKKLIRSIWKSGIPVGRYYDQAAKYFHKRALDIKGIQDVRFSSKCYCSETKEYQPAILSLVKNFGGKVVGIHRTYITGDRKADLESPKKMTPTTQKAKNCAIRLAEAPKDVLGVAEGVETALAASSLFKVPVWATISNKIMETFTPPHGIKTVWIFGDNDKSFQGQASAYKLATRLYGKFEVIVAFPPVTGDWNDIVLKQREQNAQKRS
jgi:putative DNA primase/helicase